MDGTLLQDDKTISKNTIEYLKNLESQNIMVVIASGRPFRAIEKYYNLLNLHTPVICYNGALVFDKYDDNFPLTRYMFSHYVVKEIINDIKQDNFDNIMLETDTDIYIKNPDSDLGEFFYYDNMVMHVGDVLKELNKDTYTCIFNTASHPEIKEKLVKASFKHDRIGLRFWGSSPYSELYYLCVNKGTAIERICKYYNIKQENTICFGDAENDYEMFRFCNTSVIMKNHTLKEVPEDVNLISLDDNNNDGVIKTLEYIFKKEFKI